jgi:hypothetical protein
MGYTLVQDGMPEGRENKYKVKQVPGYYVPFEEGQDKKGFAEVLEVLDPPKGMKNAMLHVYWKKPGSFHAEFETLQQAKNAYSACLDATDNNRFGWERISRQPGFVGEIHHSGHHQPWTYAM